MRFGLCEFVDCPIKGKLPSWHIRKNDNRKLLDWCEVRRQQERFQPAATLPAPRSKVLLTQALS
jgi:hypothetical protein